MDVYGKVKKTAEDIKESAQRTIIKTIIGDLDDLSTESLLKKIRFLKKLAVVNKKYVRILDRVEEAVKSDHAAVKLMQRAQFIDPNCRTKFVENLLINGMILNGKKRKKVEEEGSCAPFTVLISPTMRCNLNCVGCYAGNYDKKDDLGFETIDRVVSEAEEMGIGFFTILGGEPLVVKDELFKIFEKHSKSYFQFYTNGTLINQAVADELKRVGNAMPIISIEGDKKETDKRRGKGVYEKVVSAMKILKENKIPFGYSVMVTKYNAEKIAGDEFLDLMIDRGAFIGWHFLYIPVGKAPDLSLMPSPEQRRHLMERWKIVRETKPIFIIDFWNDAPFVGGCIAGKELIHITSKGDVEPCVFSHFATDNVKKKSLKEIMASDFFKELRKRQPLNENLYLPCMWIDNPEVPRDVCITLGCYPTHEGADDILKDEKIKKGIDEYSKKAKEVFKEPWEQWKREKGKK